MIRIGKERNVAVLTVFFLAVLGCASPSGWGEPVSRPATQPESKPATQPGDLSRYYGFGPMEILKLQWGITRPIVADVNGDGLNDIVTINNRKARIEILLQKKDFKPDRDISPEPEAEDINDIFGKERNWRFKRVPFDLDVAATVLVVADLNGDGLPDMAYYSKQGLYVVLQQPPGPEDKASPAGGAKAFPREPAWLPPKKFDIRGGLQGDRALSAGDLNGDNRTDLALLGGDGVSVLLQKPDGTLGKPLKYHTGGQRYRLLDIADIDGDGRSDLVMLTGEQKTPVRVRFQNSTGGLSPEVRYDLPSPSVFALSRLDGSSKSRFITVSAHSGRVLISTLAPNPQRVSFPVYTNPLPATENAGHRDVVAADLDGDGLLDVVVSDPGRAEFLLFGADAKNALTAPRRFPGLMDMRKLCAGDLDGKGTDAIVALSTKEKLVGISRLVKGRLSFPVSVPVTGEPLAIALADVDRDGKLDLVYIAKDKDDKKYFLRTILKLGRSDAEPGPQLKLAGLKDKPRDLRTCDIDNDGRIDVLVLGPYGPMLLIRQTEPGKFSEVADRDINSGLVAGVYPQTLSFAPLGADGAAAVLVAQKNFARAMVFDGETGWQVVDQYQAPHRQSTLAAAMAVSLDRKRGLSIVAYDSARSRLLILSRQADGTYRTTKEVKVGSITIRKMLAGNFGGQAKVSLLLAGAHKLVLVPAVAKTDLLRKVASFEPDIKNGRFGALTVGDVNGDGCPDIVLCEGAQHHLQILTFGPEGKLVSATKFKVFESPRATERSRYEKTRTTGEPRAVTLGDVTGDGKTDLVMLVHDRIIIYPQD